MQRLFLFPVHTEAQSRKLNAVTVAIIGEQTLSAMNDARKAYCNYMRIISKVSPDPDKVIVTELPVEARYSLGSVAVINGNHYANLPSLPSYRVVAGKERREVYAGTSLALALSAAEALYGRADERRRHIRRQNEDDALQYFEQLQRDHFLYALCDDYPITIFKDEPK